MGAQNSIKLSVLRKIFPKIDEAYVEPLNKAFAGYQLIGKKRQAAFLAQAGHESGNFMRFTENLNYSAAGLVKIFGKYFSTLAIAAPYARSPQKIANVVYANRMGNGAPASNDGWTFRGRGAIQLTGRDSYQAFSRDMKITIVDTIAYMDKPLGAIMSAGWFWSRNNLNELADRSDILGLTKRINGGTNGLDDRMKLYRAALAAIDNG